MVAAVCCPDAVGEGDDLLVIVVLEKAEDDLDLDSVVRLAVDGNGTCEAGLSDGVALEVFQKAVLVIEILFPAASLVEEMESHALGEAGLIVEMLRDAVEGEVRVGKDRSVRQEADVRSASCRRAEILEGGGLLASVLKPHEMVPPVLEGVDFHPNGKGIGDRGADAMEASRALVVAFIELAAAMQGLVDDLETVHLFPGIVVVGDAASLIGDFKGAVVVDGDVDVLSVPFIGFVDGIVDDFPYQVVETDGIRRSDIHAGPLADRFEAVEDRQAFGIVLVAHIKYLI